MPTGLDRRTFTQALTAGLGAALSPADAAPNRTLQFGHAGLSWNVLPRSSSNLETCLKEISSLGFYGFETFAEVIEEWDGKGTLGALLARYDLPLKAGYISLNLIDPTTRKENAAKVTRLGKVIRKYGGTYGVVASSGVKRADYVYKDHRANIVASLNDYGKALNDVGLGAGLHQHTGTAIESRDEVYDVMGAVDTKVMKFAPDVGQLQKGGADAALVVRDFLPLITHMHLKDYSGGKYFAGYCPLGDGKVDLAGILNSLEKGGKHPDVIVELDRAPDTPMSAFDAARISKVFLEGLGYKFRDGGKTGAVRPGPKTVRT